MILSIENGTRKKLPRVSFSLLANAVLPKNYELSLNFIGSKLSKRLNSTYRQKNKPTNILSFPLDNISGEIYIDLNQCKKEYKKFDRQFDNFIAFLFIHGLFHLIGYDHGSRMERAEEKIRRKFKI